MTDILKFQILLASVYCGFTCYHCNEDGWERYESEDSTVSGYIAMEIEAASDIKIVFDNEGNFKRFTHHG